MLHSLWSRMAQRRGRKSSQTLTFHGTGREREKERVNCISCNKAKMMVGYEPTQCPICNVLNQLCRCSGCNCLCILETGVLCKVHTFVRVV